uniref:Uncharacterized protein n=1 Tax=Romanomermis culicivorax TaxID=13658 RepID=A0A915HWC2_ROMCU
MNGFLNNAGAVPPSANVEVRCEHPDQGSTLMTGYEISPLESCYTSTAGAVRSIAGRKNGASFELLYFVFFMTAGASCQFRLNRNFRTVVS